MVESRVVEEEEAKGGEVLAEMEGDGDGEDEVEEDFGIYKGIRRSPTIEWQRIHKEEEEGDLLEAYPKVGRHFIAMQMDQVRTSLGVAHNHQ